MTRELVMFHGRSQQMKDPAKLKAEWLDAWKKGLAKSELKMPIPEQSVRFPYYGDTLIDLMAGLTPEEAAKIVIKGDADKGEEEFSADMVDEALKRHRVAEDEVLVEAGAEVVEKGVRNWAWVQAALAALDRKVPGMSGLTISLITRDVYAYLVTQSIRDEIDEKVLAALTPDQESVVVAHSLGTVVAVNVLKTFGESEGLVVPHLVTLGSPLAITRIKQELVQPRWPSCVSAWFNAMDERDVVPLFPLTPDHFALGTEREITNKVDVDNHTPNRHGITGYLDDKTTAKVIYDALVRED
jgi:hypothetical protein